MNLIKMISISEAHLQNESLKNLGLRKIRLKVKDKIMKLSKKYRII